MTTTTMSGWTSTRGSARRDAKAALGIEALVDGAVSWRRRPWRRRKALADHAMLLEPTASILPRAARGTRSAARIAHGTINADVLLVHLCISASSRRARAARAAAPPAQLPRITHSFVASLMPSSPLRYTAKLATTHPRTPHSASALPCASSQHPARCCASSHCSAPRPQILCTTHLTKSPRPAPAPTHHSHAQPHRIAYRYTLQPSHTPSLQLQHLATAIARCICTPKITSCSPTAPSRFITNAPSMHTHAEHPSTPSASSAPQNQALAHFPSSLQPNSAYSSLPRAQPPATTLIAHHPHHSAATSVALFTLPPYQTASADFVSPPAPCNTSSALTASSAPPAYQPPTQTKRSRHRTLPHHTHPAHLKPTPTLHPHTRTPQHTSTPS